MPPLGGIFAELSGRALDSHAEFAGLLIAGAGVKVVGSAALELVANSEFATDIDADGGDSHACRKPAEHLKALALFRLFNGLNGFVFCGHGWQCLPVEMIAQLQLDASHIGEVSVQLWLDAFPCD